MKNKAVDYLLKKEWSMGNGQCPECCGVPASWLGHHGYMNAASIGHEKNCSMAAALTDLGQTPIIKGTFKSDIEYEHYITDDGFYSTRLKTENGCSKLKDVNEKFKQQIFDNLLEIK